MTFAKTYMENHLQTGVLGNLQTLKRITLYMRFPNPSSNGDRRPPSNDVQGSLLGASSERLHRCRFANGNSGFENSVADGETSGGKSNPLAVHASLPDDVAAAAFEAPCMNCTNADGLLLLMDSQVAAE